MKARLESFEPSLKEIWSQAHSKKVADLLSAEKLKVFTKLVTELEELFGKFHPRKIPISLNIMISELKAYISLLRALFVYAQSQDKIFDLEKKVPNFDLDIGNQQKKIDDLEKKVATIQEEIRVFDELELEIEQLSQKIRQYEFDEVQKKLELEHEIKEVGDLEPEARKLTEKKQQDSKEKLKKLLESRQNTYDEMLKKTPYLKSSIIPPDAKTTASLERVQQKLSTIPEWFITEDIIAIFSTTFPQTIELFALQLRDRDIELYGKVGGMLRESKTKIEGKYIIDQIPHWRDINADVLYKIKAALSLGEQIETFCYIIIKLGESSPWYATACSVMEILTQTLPHTQRVDIIESKKQEPTPLSTKLQKIQKIFAFNVDELKKQHDEFIDRQNCKNVKAAEEWLNKHPVRLDPANIKEIEILMQHRFNIRNIILEEKLNDPELIKHAKSLVEKLREKMPEKPQATPSVSSLFRRRSSHARSKADIKLPAITKPTNPDTDATSVQTNDSISVSSSLSTPALTNPLRKISHKRSEASSTALLVGLEKTTASKDDDSIASKRKIRSEDSFFRQSSVPNLKSARVFKKPETQGIKI